MAAHVRLMFEMPVKGDGGLQDSGLCVSFEARLHAGETYSPTRGLGKTYRPIYQVGTWHDALQRKTRAKGQSVFRYKLALDNAQKQRLLRGCLADAFADQSAAWYNTATRSCYTATLQQLNAVLEPSRKIPAWTLDPRLNPLMLDARHAPSVLLEHRILASAEGIATTPDKTRFPDRQPPPGPLRQVMGALGRIPGLRAGLGVTGAVVGLSLVPWPLGRVVGALVGHQLGRAIASEMVLEANLTREPSESHFPPGFQEQLPAPGAPGAPDAPGEVAGQKPPSQESPLR